MNAQVPGSPADGLATVPPHVPAELVFPIDMYALDGVEGGYHEAWKAIQDSGVPNLVWTPHNGGHWIATKASLIKEIYSDFARFSSEIILLPKEAGEKYTIVPAQMDPPDHTPYRKIMEKALTLSRIRDFAPEIRAIAAELIDVFVDRGYCNFSDEFAQVFPVRVFMALAGLPLEDVPRLLEITSQITRPSGNTPEEMGASLDSAIRSLHNYVYPIIRERRGQEGDDLITVMVNSEVDGKQLDDDNARGLTSLLLLGGLDTVVNFLNFMMFYLARNPEKASYFAADATNIRRGTEELLRRFPILAESRKIVSDMEYSGVSFKQGDLILAPIALHNFDEELNSNPLELDLHRKRVSHITFGAGHHRCVGMNLARIELGIMLEEWFRRIPEFQIKDGKQPRFQSGFVASARNVWLEWG